MQLKKSHRFIAAFISFLLITTLCTSVFLVSAADEGEMPPSQGGVEVDTNLVDMGALAETDLTSKTRFLLQMQQGNVLPSAKFYIRTQREPL